MQRHQSGEVARPRPIGAIRRIDSLLAGPFIIRVLLAFGVIAAALYLASDVVASLRYDGYSFKSQTISELSAVGAPTRPFLLVTGLAWNVLVLGFGWGVWRVAAGNWRLAVVGLLLLVYGLVGFLWPFGPMHQREVLAADGGTWTDTLHLTLGAVDVVLAFLFIGFGAAALGPRFRVYSIATIVALLVFGTLTAMDAPRVSEDEPTRWLGIIERINVHGTMLWTAILAIVLLRGRKR